VRAFDEAAKPIASLCHGPWVLASAGLLQGRTLTSWPGVRDDLVNAGATWLDQPLVRDGNLATSRGPQDLVPFVQGCLDLFAEHAPIARTAQQRVSGSAPQANRPPDIVLGAMKWLPKPSVRTAVGLGAIAAAFMAMRPRRNDAPTPMGTDRGPTR
jgi:protease I